MDENITFLCGRVTVRQAKGYRAGLDAVLLAAAIQVKPGGKALELGCGAGTALLCTAYHNPQGHFTGLEKHHEVLHIARDNIAQNAMQDRVNIIEGSVFTPPDVLRPDSFDQVFLNPPYFDDPKAIRMPKAGKDSAFVSDQAKLKDWIHTALRLTRAKGYITIIQRADRLDDCLDAVRGRAGDIRILPIAPRAGEAAHRVIIRARRNVKTPLSILPPLIIHKPVHDNDRAWTEEAEAILQGDARIDFSGGHAAKG